MEIGSDVAFPVRHFNDVWRIPTCNYGTDVHNFSRQRVFERVTSDNKLWSPIRPHLA
jgi:hypothetical protein